MFSDVTSVIIATIVEFAQRMLTNLPTVPRTSESGIWPDARRPTRAREPRTEITRPKELTLSNPGMSKKGSREEYERSSLHKRLSRQDRGLVKSAASWRICRNGLGRKR